MDAARNRIVSGLAALLVGVSAAPLIGAAAFAADAEDVHFVHPDGSTALMWAVYEEDHDRVARLIAAGADVNAANRYGANAMQLAAEIADIELLRKLLDAGADADSPNPEGQTALHLVARTGNVEAARLLIRRGATVDAREQWGDQTPLMWAAARRHPQMVDFLIQQGADPDARSAWRDYKRHITSEARAKSLDAGGLSPLLYAARENCLECAQVLIRRGADVDLPDPERTSPLMVAIFNGNWDIAKLLIESGADVNQWDVFGQGPLFAIASRVRNTARSSIDPLNESSGREIMTMMLERGANPNMQLFMRPAKQRGGGISRGSTPLHAAAGIGDLEGVELLIQYGADVNLNDADNESALMLAMRDGSGSLFGGGGGSESNAIRIMQVLHDAGIDVDANAMYHHLARIRGGTALHYAVRAGWARAVDELIAFGIDVNIKDPDGLTALDYAEARGYIPFLQMREDPRPDIAEKLREAGATVELPEEPYWAPVSPPVYYEASIWPLSPSIPDRSYEDMAPTPFVVEIVTDMQYSNETLPPAPLSPMAVSSNRDSQPSSQAALTNAPTLP